MTTEQKQHLLAYLGLYKADIDGSYGPATKQATLDFQNARDIKPADGLFGPVVEKDILKVIGSGIKSIIVKAPVTNTTTTTTINTSKNTGVFAGIKYFIFEEFKCKCGGRYCNGKPAEMSSTLLKVADRMREYFNAPVTVTSGLRCTKHNANEGGVSNSRHLYGKAMDFAVKGKNSTQILAWVNKQPEIRYAYAVNGNVVHMDVN